MLIDKKKKILYRIQTSQLKSSPILSKFEFIFIL